MDEPNKTFDPMTAPLGDVLDWLANADGWLRTGVNGHLLWVKDGHMHRVSRPEITLDRIAGMLPDGWAWKVVDLRGTLLRGIINDRVWAATAAGTCDDISAQATTELEARARVVAAVLGMEKA